MSTFDPVTPAEPGPAVGGPDWSGVSRKAYRFAYDLGERVLWTAAQAGIAVAVTETADLPLWLSVPIAAGLSAAKGFVAKQLARKGTASTAPGV